MSLPVGGEAAMGSVALGQHSLEEDVWIFLKSGRAKQGCDSSLLPHSRHEPERAAAHLVLTPQI